ncbi:MAG TPA: cyclic nucleotide-binding domain-containing protein [Acidimicrobiia bacterium]|nr:cyclic nucleotide-binding domain-containing protein [Acidimicrobiia bacterium]
MPRYEAEVTSLSWIPVEAMTGLLRVPVDLGVGHYDPPPPDRIEDLEMLRSQDRFRFANHLRAFIEIEGAEVKAAGYLGSGLLGATTLNLGGHLVKVPAVAFPDLQHPPQVGATGVRFVQTAGGRTGAPLPRRISRPPFLQLTAPSAWTTLALTIGFEGEASFEVLGASPFPRHWIYDNQGALAQKSALIDFARWAAESSHDHSPWSDHDEAARVVDAETAVERSLSVEIMGAKPVFRRFPPGESIVQQGARGSELFLILDGIAEVSIDGEVVALAGPGAILGERAALEGGIRTATVTAQTPVRVAVSEAVNLDRDALREVAAQHRPPT